ncbi:MAG: CRTAC1 family protein, partial [Planctomycetota bacterium]
RYSLGVTSGDWNQDGFEDLVSGDVDQVVLFINNTDGTYRREVHQVPDELGAAAISSLAIADINADGVPELVVVRYVEHERINELPERDSEGRVLRLKTPLYWNMAKDVVAYQSGQELRWAPLGEQSGEASTGLGLLIADFDRDQSVDLFVANDVRPNQFFERNTEGDWIDSAGIRGLAFNYFGNSTAAMGIAAADFDQSGSLDLHVTNFDLESSSHYIRRSASRTFIDQAVKSGVNEVSFNQTGFGTQALDYQNDGYEDLLVVNGMPENVFKSHAAYAQRSQLLKNINGSFVDADGIEGVSNACFEERHSSRGLQVLDIQGDGLLDAVATRMNHLSGIWVNQTPVSGSFIKLQLVGVQSAREATGAVVEVFDEEGGQELANPRWVQAGDGYMGANQSELHIGLKRVVDVNAPLWVEVSWPSGEITGYTVKSNYRSVLVENEGAIDS